ncbi:MAG: N-methylhydantoinase A [Gammaproteobacteria bacterium]|jgi:N-methylhydantoinase A
MSEAQVGSAMGPGIRLAVDIGGTFTDLVLSTAATTVSTKVLTTPHAPEVGVLQGVAEVLAQAGVAPGELSLVIHGTTLATNALIERKGARTALLTTEGFRDSIEMAYEHRFEQYDLYMERPQPLVPRHLRFGVPERVAANGDVLVALDEAAVEQLFPVIERANVEAIAVGFLHSYANAEHEQRVGAMLADRFPDTAVTLSSDVCPEIREYERLSTACANAYVQPLMAGYLQALEAGLAELGTRCPLLLMMSSGGVTTVATAIRQPIRLIESGPAGGVILAQDIAARRNVSAALSFDMGGTTAKLTLIDDLRPQYSRSFEVARQYRFLKGSGLPVRIPVIDMVEIGAGGGSIARIDELRRVSVGPDSAGAAPGPACYGQGGVSPTVTDADVVLGRIDPATFADGKIALDAAAAEIAVRTVIADVLAIETRVAAAGISEIVDETMASAARVHAVEHGKDTADRVLIATGGAAPLHAARLAEKLGINTVIVPTGAGVGSAHGFLCAPIAYEVVRTRFMRLDAFDPEVVNGLFVQMHGEAEAVVRLGAPEAPLVELREAFMRYRGQGHEISVPLPNTAFALGDTASLRDRFDEQYKAVFGRIIPGLDVEVITWALTLSTANDTPDVIPATPSVPAPIPTGERLLFDPGAEAAATAKVYARESLSIGARGAGPAVIMEAQTTTVVPAAFTFEVDGAGNLVLNRSLSQDAGEVR